MRPETYNDVAAFTKIAMWFALVPLVIGLMRLLRAGWGWKILIVYFALSLITDNILTYLSDRSQVVLYLPRIFTFIEFVFITLFFVSITERKKVRIAMLIMFIPFACIGVLDFIYGGLAKRDDLSLGIESLLFIIYSVVTLYFILKDAQYANILARGEFWIISAVLLYFGGSIFVFISSNYVNAVSAANGLLFWALHGLFCVVFYLVSSIGLWKAKEFQ